MNLQKQLQQCISELDYIEKRAEEHQTCKRKAVGCSVLTVHRPNIVDEVGLNRIAFQHNGPSRAGNECTNIVGGCGCSHAEPRAVMEVLKKTEFLGSKIMFCTYSPCTNCANIILDSGVINGVIYDILTEHDTRGLAFLQSQIPCVTREELVVAEKVARTGMDGPARQIRSDIVEKLNAAFGRWHSNS